jgi:hypothetical protein
VKLIITPNKGYPKGIKCNVCKRVSKPGQKILWESKKNVGHTIWHAACMGVTLDQVPVLLHKDEIDAKLESIATQYSEGNYFDE